MMELEKLFRIETKSLLTITACSSKLKSEPSLTVATRKLVLCYQITLIAHPTLLARVVDREHIISEREGLLLLFVVYFILSRLLCLAYSANLGLLCIPHPGMGPLV